MVIQHRAVGDTLAFTGQWVVYVVLALLSVGFLREWVDGRFVG